MRHELIAIATLAICAPPALAQDGGGGELARIAEEMRILSERVESINSSSTMAFIGSFAGSMAVAGIAVWATIRYARQLERNTDNIEEQVKQSEEQLGLAREDAQNRLRPMLAWGLFEDGDLIKMSGPGERPRGLSIRVINTGQVSARDIVVHLDARIVGAAAPRFKMRRLGALGPGRSVNIPVHMSAEDLGSAMGGGLAYLEARFVYRDGGGRELGYTVAGYRSNTVSTLFGGEDAVPRDGGGAGAHADPEDRAAAPAGKGAPGVQSAGSHARDLAASQAPQGGMPADEARARLAACEGKIRGDSRDAEAHRGMAAALRALGRNEDALRAIKTADAIRGGDPATLKETARILEGLGQTDEAIGRLNVVLELDGNDLDARREQARLHTLLGEYDLAYSAWASTAGQDPTHGTYMRMASVCVAMRRHGAAIVAFGQAIERRPGDARAHLQKGIAQLSNGQHVKAAPTLRRAAELDRGMGDAHVNLAHALYGLGGEAEAAESLDRAVEAEPGNQKAHIDRGVLMLEMGHRERARASFEAAKRLDPSMLVPGGGAWQ